MASNDVTRPGVPPEKWIQHPVSDHADYANRPDPVYRDSLTAEQKKEFDAASKPPEPEPAKKPQAKKPKRSRRRRA